MHEHGREAADRNPAGRRAESSHRRAAGQGGGVSVSGILNRVSREVGEDSYRRYFEHQARVSAENGFVQVTVPTGFVADLIGRRFGDSLRRAASEEHGGRNVEVKFRIDRSAFLDPALGGAGARQAARPESRPAPRPAPTRYRLEDFEVGKSNELAHAAAVTLASRECPRSAHPLFIHGPCGVGKTHLLQGIAQSVRERGATVVYTTAETFTNEFITAVQGNGLDAFRKRYRGVQFLCIDDVQFLQNKTGTQRELLHTFDAIDVGGARVVLASDEHPRKVQQLSEALVSRFMAGMVVKLDSPEPELRARIVSRLAAKRGLKIDGAGAALIASRCGGAAPSARDIEGILSRIEALRSLPGGGGGDASRDGTIGLVLIRRALGVENDQGRGDRPLRPVRMTLIIQEVCRVLRVDASELFGKGRHKRVVLARSMCAVLGRWLTTMSYPEIARALGRPNHSTVVTAVKRLEGQMASDQSTGPYLGHDLDGLAAELMGLSLRMLAQQLRDDILRCAPEA